MTESLCCIISAIMYQIATYLWIPVLAAGLALFIGVRIYAGRKRTRHMREFAAACGFRPLKEKPLDKRDRKRLPLFRRGSGRKFSDLFIHESGAVIGDYGFRFGLPLIASVTYWQSFLLLPVTDGSLPDFQLSPATIVDKAAGKLGLKHVKIESDQEFSRRYLVRTTDDVLLSARLIPITTDIMALDPAHQLFIEKAGNWLLVYGQGRLVHPQSWPAFWNTGQQIRALLSPTHKTDFVHVEA